MQPQAWGRWARAQVAGWITALAFTVIGFGAMLLQTRIYALSSAGPPAKWTTKIKARLAQRLSRPQHRHTRAWRCTVLRPPGAVFDSAESALVRVCTGMDVRMHAYALSGRSSRDRQELVRGDSLDRLGKNIASLA